MCFGWCPECVPSGLGVLQEDSGEAGKPRRPLPVLGRDALCRQRTGGRSASETEATRQGWGEEQAQNLPVKQGCSCPTQELPGLCPSEGGIAEGCEHRARGRWAFGKVTTALCGPCLPSLHLSSSPPLLPFPLLVPIPSPHSQPSPERSPVLDSEFFMAQQRPELLRAESPHSVPPTIYAEALCVSPGILSQADPRGAAELEPRSRHGGHRHSSQEPYHSLGHLCPL